MRRVLKKSGQLGKTNCDAVIRVYDEAGNVSETHEHTGDFKGWRSFLLGHVIERFRLALFFRD